MRYGMANALVVVERAKISGGIGWKEVQRDMMGWRSARKKNSRQSKTRRLTRSILSQNSQYSFLNPTSQSSQQLQFIVLLGIENTPLLVKMAELSIRTANNMSRENLLEDDLITCRVSPSHGLCYLSYLSHSSHVRGEEAPICMTDIHYFN